jgi:L-asparaginase
MLILNSGGTFNKRYDALTGLLEVPYDNKAVETILETIKIDYDLAGVIYKDSLDIDSNDRKMLANIIMESNDDTFVLIHGTDTMGITAEFLSEVFDDRVIVITGAMKPFEVDAIEASLNLGMAIGYANAQKDYGVYISMSGITLPWNKIEKNTEKGIFQIVR